MKWWSRTPPPARPTPVEPPGPGLDLGRVTVAPPQKASVFANQRFWMSLADLQHHATVIGMTGSGKTTTLGRLMDAAMAGGWSVLVVDAKGGRLANVCTALGAAHALPARVWLPGHPASWTYDLCAGEATAVGNRLVGAFEHGRDGQVYRNLSQALVPMAARALHASGQACTLDSLRYSLDEAHLAGLARREADVAVKAELVAMLQDGLHRKALSGLVGRLRSLRYGGFGPWLLPSERSLDLATCLQAPGVTYLGLPATAASEDVALVGRVLIQHLKQIAYAGLWSDEPHPSLVIFDEFASLGEAVQLTDLLLQAREASLAVVISTQQLPKEPVLRKALLGAGVLGVHQVGAPEDGEVLAKALGTRSGTEVVRQIQLGPNGPIARRLLRGRESFVVSPDQLARLPIGQAAISIRFAQQRIALIQVDPLRLNPKES
ncbi:MAG: type IV secretory system conjugative DNA transfer family protein [Chloroflexota bacterium]